MIETLPPETEHKAKLKDLIYSSLLVSPTLELMDAIGAQFQKVENLSFGRDLTFYFNDADTEQLDTWGNFLGIPNPGVPPALYRRAISCRLRLRYLSYKLFAPNGLIPWLTHLTDAKYVEQQKSPPFGHLIMLYGDTHYSEELLRLWKEIVKPVGATAVGLNILYGDRSNLEVEIGTAALPGTGDDGQGLHVLL